MNGPLPFPRGEEAAWFEAAAAGRLLVQRCADCGAVASYPRAVCPSCWSDALVEVYPAGTGVVHSFTVQYRAGAPELADEVPYALALVDLDEGGRVLADLQDYEVRNLTVGLRVEAFFDADGDDVPLPHFRPLTAESA